MATNSPTNAPPMATNGPSMATPMVGIGQKSAPAPVIELDSRPVGDTSTNRPTIAPNALPSNNPLVCNECGIGPFDNQLKLQSHKATAHPVKKARRKKTIVGLTASTAPVPTASTPSTPTATAPVPFTASPEQATLPTTSDVKPSQTTEAQAPAQAASEPTTPASTVPKVEGGTSEAAEKYAKLCGLVKKPLADFKNQFEASFPGHDIAKVLEAAHCTIVDEKVVFIGGN
jgi:hypothetical protein